jgi:hypothetical protein
VVPALWSTQIDTALGHNGEFRLDTERLS